MNKVSAYAKLLRVPGMGALGIVSVIGAISVGMYDLYNLTIVFLIGSFASVFGFLINDYVDIKLDRFVDDLQKKTATKRRGIQEKCIDTCLLSCFFYLLHWTSLVQPNP